MRLGEQLRYRIWVDFGWKMIDEDLLLCWMSYAFNHWAINANQFYAIGFPCLAEHLPMCQIQTNATKMQKLLSTHAYKFLWGFITQQSYAYIVEPKIYIRTHTNKIVSKYNLHKNVPSSNVRSVPLLNQTTGYIRCIPKYAYIYTRYFALQCRKQELTTFSDFGNTYENRMSNDGT